MFFLSNPKTILASLHWRIISTGHLSLSVFLFFFMSVSLSAMSRVSLSLFLCICLSVSLSLCLCLSVSLSLWFCLSFCLSLSLPSLSLSLFIYLSLSFTSPKIDFQPPQRLRPPSLHVSACLDWDNESIENCDVTLICVQTKRIYKNNFCQSPLNRSLRKYSNVFFLWQKQNPHISSNQSQNTKLVLF